MLRCRAFSHYQLNSRIVTQVFLLPAICDEFYRPPAVIQASFCYTIPHSHILLLPHTYCSITFYPSTSHLVSNSLLPNCLHKGSFTLYRTNRISTHRILFLEKKCWSYHFCASLSRRALWEICVAHSQSISLVLRALNAGIEKKMNEKSRAEHSQPFLLLGSTTSPNHQALSTPSCVAQRVSILSQARWE